MSFARLIIVNKWLQLWAKQLWFYEELGCLLTCQFICSVGAEAKCLTSEFLNSCTLWFELEWVGVIEVMEAGGGGNLIE